MRRILAPFVAIVLVLLLWPEGAAAVPRVRWTREFAHFLNAVAADDRSAFVTGYRQVGVHSETWDRAMVLRRYRADGTAIWTRRWNPESVEQDAYWDVTAQGEAIALGPDGEIVVAGTCWVDIESAAWFVRAYSSKGELLWSRAPGLRGKEGGSGTPTAVAVRGDLVVLAGYASLWPGSDGWLRAFDLDGHLRWSRDFEVPGFRRFSDSPRSVAIGALGNIYVAGQVATSSEYDGGPNAHDTDREIVVQKLTTTGRRLWTRVLRDRPEVVDQDRATSIAVRGARLAVAGLVNARDRRAGRVWLGAFTTGGHRDWRRVWERVPTGERGPSVTIQASGSIVVTGSTRDRSDRGLDAFVRRFAPGGRVRWTLRLPEDAPYVVSSGVALGPPRAILLSGWLLEDEASARGTGRLWRIRG